MVWTDDRIVVEHTPSTANGSAITPHRGQGCRPGLDAAQALKRFLEFAALFGKPRWKLTTALMNLFPDVDLFTTLLVASTGPLLSCGAPTCRGPKRLRGDRRVDFPLPLRARQHVKTARVELAARSLRPVTDRTFDLDASSKIR
jgi:hypothetical protein